MHIVLVMKRSGKVSLPYQHEMVAVMYTPREPGSMLVHSAIHASVVEQRLNLVAILGGAPPGNSEASPIFGMILIIELEPKQRNNEMKGIINYG